MNIVHFVSYLFVYLFYLFLYFLIIVKTNETGRDEHCNMLKKILSIINMTKITKRASDVTRHKPSLNVNLFLPGTC